MGGSMRLMNKQTGEIATLTLSSNGEELLLMKDNEMVTREVKLSDLNEWEDYEEPKEYWYIDWTPEIGAYYTRDTGSDADERQKQIGNYFETKEEAEKAAEKLKAWKRMKECGLRFWDLDTVHLKIGYSFENYTKEDIPQLKKDLALIFGGEE